METNREPKLAPPGAGLPKIELAVARLLFARRRKTGNRAIFDAHFRAEREVIRRLVKACRPEAAGRRVLIQRPRGLEDSSRYWSVWMTLGHLRIVNHGLAKTIGALTKGIVPPGKASTAALKPSPDVTAAVEAEFEAACDALLTATAVINLNSGVRFDHPWFGPLDATGWHALAGGHLGIHRVQIERILQGLKDSA